MRLTGKNTRMYIPLLTSPNDQKSVNYYKYVDMYNKLADLEDILEGHKVETLEELDGLLWYVKEMKKIEEELGIDLITFFKIYNSDKVHIKGKDYYWKIKHYNRHSILVGTNRTIYLHFKDYGKTWALTKEELL